jgi:hypothetical protein
MDLRVRNVGLLPIPSVGVDVPIADGLSVVGFCGRSIPTGPDFEGACPRRGLVPLLGTLGTVRDAANNSSKGTWLLSCVPLLPLPLSDDDGNGMVDPLVMLFGESDMLLSIDGSRVSGEDTRRLSPGFLSVVPDLALI